MDFFLFLSVETEICEVKIKLSWASSSLNFSVIFVTDLSQQKQFRKSSVSSQPPLGGYSGSSQYQERAGEVLMGQTFLGSPHWGRG